MWWAGRGVGGRMVVVVGGGDHAEKRGPRRKGGMQLARGEHYATSPAREGPPPDPPIHLPNFGQFNQLGERGRWLCQGGRSLLIELTACFDPVNVIRKGETIPLPRPPSPAPKWRRRSARAHKREPGAATGNFLCPPPRPGSDTKRHYFILEYV